MAHLRDPVLMVVLALNLLILGVSHVRPVVRTVALQGILFGALPLLVSQEISLHQMLFSIAAIALKGYVIPRLLFQALREISVQRELEPIVGFVPSVLLGAVGTGLAMVFASRMPLLESHKGSLLIPASLSTVLTGFLILTTRRKAILQVVGYLVLENGVFTFGLLLLEAMPFLVEIGVLLDLFTGVFIMGIMLHRINREFVSPSRRNLAQLKE